MPEGVGN
ncbi:hypothetical protein V3C99_006551 [Haemonchus contortus]